MEMLSSTGLKLTPEVKMCPTASSYFQQLRIHFIELFGDQSIHQSGVLID